VTPLLGVTHMAFAGVMTPDPAASARRFAELFDRPITFVDAGAGAGDPQAGVSIGDMTLAIYPMPRSGDSERLWGYRYDRAMTCNVGLRVDDLDAARTALLDAGIALVRHDAHSIVIHPDATGGVIVVLVAELLAGDPRRS
jgi:hypothetical protein